MKNTLSKEQKKELKREYKINDYELQLAFNKSQKKIHNFNQSENLILTNNTANHRNLYLALLLTLTFIAIFLLAYVTYDNYRYSKNQEILTKEGALKAADAVPYNDVNTSAKEAKPIKSHEDMVKEAWASVNSMNLEIDAAQDEVLNDFKKQAVEHFVSNGAGRVKVDTFILKNGEMKICTTTISDQGKAIDCH